MPPKKGKNKTIGKEGDAGASVVLGLPGDWLEQEAKTDHYTTKAGGSPAWIPNCQAFLKAKRNCEKCCSRLHLVVQTFAPLQAQQVGLDIPERVLYIFACLTPQCGTWRALRVQSGLSFSAKEKTTTITAADQSTPSHHSENRAISQSNAQPSSKSGHGVKASEEGGEEPSNQNLPQIVSAISAVGSGAEAVAAAMAVDSSQDWWEDSSWAAGGQDDDWGVQPEADQSGAPTTWGAGGGGVGGGDDDWSDLKALAAADPWANPLAADGWGVGSSPLAPPAPSPSLLPSLPSTRDHPSLPSHPCSRSSDPSFTSDPSSPSNPLKPSKPSDHSNPSNPALRADPWQPMDGSEPASRSDYLNHSDRGSRCDWEGEGCNDSLSKMTRKGEDVDADITTGEDVEGDEDADVIKGRVRLSMVVTPSGDVSVALQYYPPSSYPADIDTGSSTGCCIREDGFASGDEKVAKSAASVSELTQKVEDVSFLDRSSVEEKTHQPLPSFVIDPMQEDPGHQTQGGKQKTRDSIPADHVQALIDQYEREESSSLPGGGESSGGGEPTTWIGEAYEYDHSGSVDRTFLKFSKRINKYPEQCLRYSFGGVPLFPTNTIGQTPLPKCRACGAWCQFELQLMPALLCYFEEGVQYLHNQGGQCTLTASSLDLDSWDWGTAALFTCSKSCAGERAGGHSEAFCVEEHIFVSTA